VEKAVKNAEKVVASIRNKLFKPNRGSTAASRWASVAETATFNLTGPLFFDFFQPFVDLAEFFFDEFLLVL